MAVVEQEHVKIAGDANWLAHRHDVPADAIHFVRAPRELHRSATFLTDEYLPSASEPVVVPRRSAMAAVGATAPIHFIFHSAYCCSTLLARALDIDGVSMALKEPVILNDMVGWRHRGGDTRQIAEVLGNSLTLLARPFAPGEKIVVKPSNVVNALIPAILAMRPTASALLLYAPLRVYLSSIARKGMWGRLWVRELFVKLGKDGLVNYGFSAEETLRQTDLQIAALGWLGQQRLFAGIAGRHAERVRTLNSEVLTARPREVLAALSSLFGLSLADPGLDAVIASDVFRRHSKDGSAFDGDRRAEEQRAGAELHSEEVEKVAVWAEAVALTAGQKLELPGALLG